jgi:hypothetical protein
MELGNQVETSTNKNLKIDMGHYFIPRGSQNFLQMRYYLQYRTQLTMPYMIHA